VFIVVACGAASGFHSLVSSGTTAKQINRETDARFVAYGGMIGESLLGLLAVLACTAGFRSSGAWQHAYRDWATIEAGLANKLGAFIQGTSRFIGALGVPDDLAAAFIAVVVVSFALTTLDSATRLLRFNVAEIAVSVGARPLANRFIATAIAVAAITFFAFYEIDGLALWTLFGLTNQLLAGLALLVVSLYLHQRRRNAMFTGLPMLFMLTSTFVGLMENLSGFLRDQQYLLLVVGFLLLLIAVWIIVEAVIAYRRGTRHDDDQITFQGEPARI
jgi:carbon starvation protein